MPIQRWSDRIWIAKLSDEPALSEDLVGLKAQAVKEQVIPHMVLDLTGVEQVNSTNLSQMLRLRKMAIDRDAKLVLVGPSNGIWAVFLTTGLDKVFEFAPDVSTALAGLQINE